MTDGFATLAFSRDGRPVPLADPAALLALLADPAFDLLVAKRAGGDPDAFAQTAEVPDGFVFEVWQGGEPVLEQVLATPAEVVEALRRWATGT